MARTTKRSTEAAVREIRRRTPEGSIEPYKLPSVRTVEVLALLILGSCRSVWVHPEWYEGKYEADLHDCSREPNWKICMVARGWYTETASRSAPRTRPAK